MGDVLPADLVVLYQDAFFGFDTDKDGVILIKQLGALLRQCGENPTEGDIQVHMLPASIEGRKTFYQLFCWWLCCL